jgi:Ca-activated chloride channel homolog
MTFESGGRLWLLTGVVVLLIAYVLLQRRNRKYAIRFTNVPLLDKIAPKRPGWRRHVPAGLFLAMLAVLVVGFAQPIDEVQVPRERATVIVAVDVSRSMSATDVEPDRLAAARAAAHEFVDMLPPTFNVGLVAFAGNASVTVSPVTDRAALRAGIDRLTLGSAGLNGTAIGEAITASLRAIRSVDADAEPPPARAVVLSDGANTVGRSPDEAATEAATANVPVDTISVGTESGSIELDGGAQRVPVDGETLRSVAERTGGSYHEAATAAELREVYADIGSSVGFRTEQRDVSSRFIGFGLGFALATAAASMFFFSRIP